MKFPGLRNLFLSAEIAMLSGAILGLSGCALGGFDNSPSQPVVQDPTPGAPVQGKVIGGQNAITGAHIYLFAAGQSAAAHTYGTGAQSLLTSAVLTNNTSATDAATHTGIGGQDSNGLYYIATGSYGDFNLAGDYSCSGQQVYILSIGGNAGSGGGSNSNIALMAALGPCASASALAAAVPFIYINEVTTVAAVWALQQFMSVPTGSAGSVNVNIGGPTTNVNGLTNAFTWAANLANVANGTAVPTNTVATPEADRIYTIADILSYCVNSAAPSSDCSNVFASVTPGSSALSTKGVAAGSLTGPVDTIQAAWFLAQFPTNIGGSGTCGTTAAAFQCIQATGAPFTALGSAPTDWTIAVGVKPLYNSSSAINDPYYVVLDGYGNAWVDTVGTSTSSVVPLAPNGTAIYAPVTSYAVGANSGYSAYSNTTYGTTQAGATTHTIVTGGPRGMTVDSNGNVWMADYNNNGTTGYTISGGTTNCSSLCYFGTLAKFPAATGIGTASSTGITGYYSPPVPWPLAADANGNVYGAFGYTTNGVRAIGVFNSSGAYTQGGTTGVHTFAIAIDNDTQNTNGPFIWADITNGCASGGGEASLIAEYETGSPATKTTYSGLYGANNTACSGSDALPASTSATGAILGMAFDASNNIWLVNESAVTGYGSQLGPTGAINTVTYGVVSKPASGTGVYVNPSASAYASVSSSAGLAGMNNPQYAEVDGSGNLWIDNYGAPAISEVNVTGAGTSSIAINSLSGTSGFQHSETASALVESEGMGIDLSGNVWVANTDGSAIHYMTVLVGAATPVGPLIPGNYGVAP